jgi:hypothetical protein
MPHTPNFQTDSELEHRSVSGVEAKAVVPYGYTGSSLTPFATPLIDQAYDYIGWTSADANGNYQTITFKIGGSAGTTVRTLAVTYDGSSNITSITRT